MQDKPYIIKTSNNYEVSLPDKDGDICVEFDCEKERAYFTKADLEFMLKRFE